MKKGFTLIEIIITIVIWAILIIPLAFMMKEHFIGLATAADITVASSLARLEMSKVNNLSYTDATLADGYNNTTTNYEGYRYDLKRTVNYVAGSGNNLKKVAATVYESATTRPLASLTAYVANVSFGAGGGGATAGGIEANALVVSGGSISGKDLLNVTLQNADTTNSITITQITASFTGASGIKLQKISIGGTDVFSGNADSGETITLSPNFTLLANTSYSSPVFLQFNKDVTSVSSIVFTMGDGSETISYSW